MNIQKAKMTVTNIKSTICQTCQVLNNPKGWNTFQNLMLVKCINVNGAWSVKTIIQRYVQQSRLQFSDNFQSLIKLHFRSARLFCD